MPLLEWLQLQRFQQSPLRAFLIKQMELQAILTQSSHRMIDELQGVLRARLPLSLAEHVLADDRIIRDEPAFAAHICEATRSLYVSRSHYTNVTTVRVWDDVERLAIAGAKGMTEASDNHGALKECIAKHLRTRAWPHSAAEIANNKLTLAFLRLLRELMKDGAYTIAGVDALHEWLAQLLDASSDRIPEHSDAGRGSGKRLALVAAEGSGSDPCRSAPSSKREALNASSDASLASGRLEGSPATSSRRFPYMGSFRTLASCQSFRPSAPSFRSQPSQTPRSTQTARPTPRADPVVGMVGRGGRTWSTASADDGGMGGWARSLVRGSTSLRVANVGTTPRSIPGLRSPTIPWVGGRAGRSEAVADEKAQHAQLRYEYRCAHNFDTGLLMSIRVVTCEVLRLDVEMRLDLDLGFLLRDFKKLTAAADSEPQLPAEGELRGKKGRAGRLEMRLAQLHGGDRLEAQIARMNAGLLRTSSARLGGVLKSRLITVLAST